MKRKSMLGLLFSFFTLLLVGAMWMQYGSSMPKVHAAAPTVKATPHYADDNTPETALGITRPWDKHHPPTHPNDNTNLTYHLGRVISDTLNVYLIFWEPTGSSVSSVYNADIMQYFNDSGNTSLYQNNHQYYSLYGRPRMARLADTWVDTSKYPSGSLADYDIHKEIVHAMQTKGWSSDDHNVFFLYTAQGEKICSPIAGGCNINSSGDPVWCGFHSHTGVIFFTRRTLYAVIAYPVSGPTLTCEESIFPNDLYADSAISVSSHEEMESATDPFGLGWTEGIFPGGPEIGDKCKGMFSPYNYDGGLANEMWNGHFYTVQEEWSNAISGCTQG